MINRSLTLHDNKNQQPIARLASVALSGRAAALLEVRVEVAARLALGSLGSLRSLGLADDSASDGARDNLGGEGQVLSQVVNALRGEDVVVVSPVEGLGDEALGSQGSHEAQHLQVGDVEGLRVLRSVEILLGDKGAL